MNWSYMAVQRLKAYESRREAIKNIPEEIALLTQRFQSIRAAVTDGTPVQESGNRREEMLVYNIAKREELKINLEIARREVRLTEKGLAALSDEERRILELFYITRGKKSVERLCEELFVSKTELYRRKDEALRKFTMCSYGVVEL